jgi:hypothetical protein
MRVRVIRTSGKAPEIEGVTPADVEFKSPKGSYTVTCWTTELESVADLVKFTESVGNVVFSTPLDLGCTIPTIEIYDDYRE